MLQRISDIIWGPFTPFVFAVTGLYFIIRLKFFSWHNTVYIFRNTLGALFNKKTAGGLSSFSAMATALGGTIGVGNTVGVASAVISGGLGAVFWMIVAAFFGMAIKYAEIYLAVKYKNSNSGGAVYYIEKGLNCPSLALIFAAVCVLTSFGMGNMAQSDAASQYISRTFHLSPFLCGIIFALITFYMIKGGIRRIASVSAIMVPVMAILYVLAGIIIIVINYRNIPSAFCEIFRCAFDFSGVRGGFIGFFLSDAIRYGFSRGLFSNEAGMGSAPTAHCASAETNPKKQAVWGVFEVFCDTVAVCGITALAIAVSGKKAETNPSALIYNIFTDIFGFSGGAFLSISIAFFALASIFCWYIYGNEALKYITKNKFVQSVYAVLFCYAVFLGAVAGTDTVWNISDILNGIMAFINIFVLVMLRCQVKM